MMPKFRDMATWQQAEQLMQPAFIRLLDNIRKQLEEQSIWQGTYEEFPVWPEGISDEVKATVQQLQQQLETATSDQFVKIEQELAQLPSPCPGYHLCLTQQDQRVTVDLWELCYRICFLNYNAATGTSFSPVQLQDKGVEIDSTLFDEIGEVDWHRLDDKAQRLVAQVFAGLPAANAVDSMDAKD
jgi:hypothetical protein